MIAVLVFRGGKWHSGQVTAGTHEILRDGAFLRGRPMHFYLGEIVRRYGALNDENVQRYMDEYWVL